MSEIVKINAKCYCNLIDIVSILMNVISVCELHIYNVYYNLKINTKNSNSNLNKNNNFKRQAFIVLESRK